MPRELIYGIQDDGRLLWYRHDRASGGPALGANLVGEGWDFKQVFAGADGPCP